MLVCFFFFTLLYQYDLMETFLKIRFSTQQLLSFQRHAQEWETTHSHKLLSAADFHNDIPVQSGKSSGIIHVFSPVVGNDDQRQLLALTGFPWSCSHCTHLSPAASNPCGSSFPVHLRAWSGSGLNRGLMFGAD